MRHQVFASQVAKVTVEVEAPTALWIGGEAMPGKVQFYEEEVLPSTFIVETTRRRLCHLGRVRKGHGYRWELYYDGGKIRKSRSKPIALLNFKLDIARVNRFSGFLFYGDELVKRSWVLSCLLQNPDNRESAFRSMMMGLARNDQLDGAGEIMLH